MSCFETRLLELMTDGTVETVPGATEMLKFLTNKDNPRYPAEKQIPIFLNSLTPEEALIDINIVKKDQSHSIKIASK